MLHTLEIHSVGHCQFKLILDDIEYKPTEHTAHAGALVFALQPDFIKTDGKYMSEQFKHMANVAIAQLRGHVKGRTIPEDILDGWRWGAINLAQCAKDAAEVMWRFDKAAKVSKRYEGRLL